LIAIVNRSGACLEGNISAGQQFLPLRFTASQKCDRAMRASVNKNVTGSIHDRLLHLGPSGDREDGVPRSNPTRPVPVDREDLPYKVEIWNEPGASVERVIAVTANASIGYATYYAAIREYPDRHITLRHKNSVVARWSGPRH
jgi:hypothetical protein